MKKCIVLAIAGALFVTQIPVMAESGCAFYDQYGYHDWEYGDYVQPSCTEWGYAQYVCSSCGTWEPEDIPPWGHIWEVSEEFYSTCVSYGYVEYTCSLCASSYKEDTYPSGHYWEDDYVIKNATCSQSGSMQTYCIWCGETSSRTLDRTAHTYGEWKVTKEASDSSKGVKTSSCTVCGTAQTEEFYPEGTFYRGISNVEGVKNVQTMLVDCGYLNDVVDGIFGKNTEQAVKDFQSQNGLNADGIAWPQTIVALNEKWGIKMGYIAEPTPEPTPTPEAVKEHCAYITYEDGIEEVIICEDHELLHEMTNTYMSKAKTEEDYLKIMKQCKALWSEELELLYEEWLSVLDEEEKIAATARKSIFDASYMAHENVFNEQLKDDPALAVEMMNSLLIAECTEVCSLIYEEGAIPISTPAGNVEVELVDGWYLREDEYKTFIALHNDAVGDRVKTWIMISEYTADDSMETEKERILKNYPDTQFEEMTIGEVTYQGMKSEDGTVFNLLTETSEGILIKISSRNCSMEQAETLLETITVK